MDATVDVSDLEFTEAPWGELGRSATLAAVSLVSKFILKVMNDFRTENNDTFLELITQRPEGVGLITVSNHTRSGGREAAAVPSQRAAPVRIERAPGMT